MPQISFRTHETIKLFFTIKEFMTHLYKLLKKKLGALKLLLITPSDIADSFFLYNNYLAKCGCTLNYENCKLFFFHISCYSY